MNSCASFQDTVAGCSARARRSAISGPSPKLFERSRSFGSDPITCVHCAWVVSVLLMANGLVSVTSCWAFSASVTHSASAGAPIRKIPAGNSIRRMPIEFVLLDRGCGAAPLLES
jgi:hypothetical protein